MTGIVKNQGHKLIAINGMPDHVHVFIGADPKQAISELMQYLKMDSSKWINEEKLTQSRFEWQTGHDAFSYSHSQIDAVVKYIENQEQHHQKQSFLDEYTTFFQKSNVP